MTDWTGYDEHFLSEPVPMPAPLSPDGATLPYPRFSVVLDPERLLAVVTGVNIDGATLRDLERTGDWELDPRIGADEQVGPAVYAVNDLDRGHLVRRRDPGWGSAADARAATEATFFYPNAAPQAAVFNQSKDLWLGLEDHVLAFAGAQRLRVSVFTAPVLDAEDPPYRGIRIPLRFWKVAGWIDADGQLQSAGFVLDQTELVGDATAIAVEPLGTYRTFQVPVSDIEAIARVDLGALVDADVFVAPGSRGAERWNPLHDPADIDLG